MNIIAVLKGNLKEYKKVDIGIVNNFGRLIPEGKDQLTVISTDVIFKHPDLIEVFVEPEVIKEAYITVDYTLTEGINIATLKVWDINAKAEADGHVKMRNVRYEQMAKVSVAVQEWNKAHDDTMQANIDTIQSYLLDAKITLDDFIKDNNVDPKQLAFSAILSTKLSDELILKK